MICVARRIVCIVPLVVVFVAGCSPGVREDRTITFSSDGRSVGFQHGDAGVFLNDIQGGAAEQIYTLEPGEIVASSPQFSSDDHLIFAVARPYDSDQELAQDPRTWDEAPSGRQYFPGATEYKCMYRPSGAIESEELFVARCDHTGYVAANLAVRWHPSGKSIWYVDQTDAGQAAIFEYTLADKSRRRITSFESAALVFEFSSTGAFASCASLGTANGVVQFCSVDDEQWRELPDSGLAGSPTADWLEQLRASLPEFDSRDEACVYKALANVRASADPDTERWHTELRHFDFQSMKARLLHDAFGDIRDIHWHTADASVAFVNSENQLRLLATNNSEQTLGTEMLASDVRSFAGFSADGSWIGYTSAEQPGTARSTDLFTPIEGARDRLFFLPLAPNGHLTETAAAVQSSFDSMRLTFPHWSPSESKLSAWATFAPTHTSQLSTLIPWTLAPGDPAIVIDADTGNVNWMPVNATEEAQIGHYYLTQLEDSQAWRWYEKSIDDRVPMQPIKLSSWQLFANQSRVIQDSTFFEFICLQRLGRLEAAGERLALFNKHFVLDQDDFVQLVAPANAGETVSNEQSEAARKLVSRITDAALPILKASYVTEIYLSLDAATEGVEFFTEQAKQSLTPWEKLANRLCLSHLILATGQADAYAEFALTELVPAFDAMNQPASVVTNVNSASLVESWPDVEQAFARLATASAMLPLLSEKLAAMLAPESHDKLVSRLEALVASSTDEMRTRFLTRIRMRLKASHEGSRIEDAEDTLEALSPEAAQQAALLEQLEENSEWTIVQPN